MDSKTKSYLIFGGFITYCILLLLFWDRITSIIVTGNFFVGTFIYMITNPAYLLLIFYVVKYTPVSKWKSTLASIALIFALDIASSPRVILSEIQSLSMATDFATILIKMFMGWGFNGTLSYYLVYLIIPVGLFFLSMEMLGYINFVRKLKNGGA